ncbi:MAG: GNAT family N-acetyltransferase [Anaerolineaceae bacterium]
MPTLNPPGLLRRFNPAQDADAVVKLVEEAFNLKSDPEGQSMLQQMRSDVGRLHTKPALRLATGGTEGYVWEVEGQIVGNITLLPFQSGLKPIILIANVAVDKQWQGRGIGTELTRHALRVARQRPFSEIWLQVRSDNARAIKIYQTLGFRFFVSLTQWRRPARNTTLINNFYEHEDRLFRRRLSDWSLQEAWLTQAYPKQTRWYANFNFNLLKPLAWVNPLHWVDLMNTSTYCLRNNDKLLAAITHQQTTRRVNRLWLAVDTPKPADRRVTTLLGTYLQTYWDGVELDFEYPAGWAAEAITQAGFIAKRDLDWMQFDAK